MREYSVIRDAIQNLGASVIEEYLHPEAFGSAYCVFECNGAPSFRFVWDGKEGYGFLQRATSPGLWETVGPYVSEASNTSSPKLAELLSIAQGLAHGNA